MIEDLKRYDLKGFIEIFLYKSLCFLFYQKLFVQRKITKINFFEKNVKKLKTFVFLSRYI